MNNTKDEFIIGFSDCKDIAIELLSNTINILNEYDIQHFLISGTLLGHVRNKDFIEWDDDIDLIVDESILYKINDIFLKYNIQYSFFVIGDLIKICFNNSYREIDINEYSLRTKKFSLNKNDKYNFPFIDLFIYKDNGDDYISFFSKKWDKKYFFPKSEEYFNNILVSIPKDPFYFLKKNYKNYNIYKLHEWNHREDRMYTDDELEYLNYKYFKTYNINIINLNNRIYYEFKSYIGSIYRLIKEIDNDDLNYINKYKKCNYDPFVNNTKKLLLKYINLNNKKIINNINNISYCLTLFLFIIVNLDYYKDINYNFLKNKLYLTNNLKLDNLIIDDWFRISDKIVKTNKQFVIFKGYEGFADRLQCLLNIINYCIKTDRILVIDWKDKLWDTENGFDYYFYLENIKYMKYEDFKIFYSKNEHLSIYPNTWKNKLFHHPNHKIYKKKNKLLTYNIIDTDLKFDIIVYCGVGIRYLYYDLFKHFRMHQHILNKIYNHNFYKEIILKKQIYVCIHLRGSDKMVKNKFHYNGSINNDEYIDNLLNKLPGNIINILIISDTTLLINKCIEKLNKYKKYNIYTTDNYKTNLNIGLHQQNMNQLQISKVQINIEMIIDFYFMIKSEKIINDNYSIFSNSASEIQEYKINY